MSIPRSVVLTGAISAVALLAAPASADISDVVFHIRATGPSGTGQWMAHLADGGFNPDGSWSWNLGGPVQVRSQSGELLATLEQGSTTIINDPQITLGFLVTAAAVDTNFTITSALLSFPTLTNPDARISGGVTVTDTAQNGATGTGNHAGDFLRGDYNGLVPGGTLFQTIIAGPVIATPGGSNIAGENFPPVGFVTIPGSVTDMSMQWSFTLSANDTASGTGTYIIVPGPAGAGLLGVAGLALLRRRR